MTGWFEEWVNGAFFRHPTTPCDNLISWTETDVLAVLCCPIARLSALLACTDGSCAISARARATTSARLATTTPARSQMLAPRTPNQTLTRTVSVRRTMHARSTLTTTPTATSCVMPRPSVRNPRLCSRSPSLERADRTGPALPTRLVRFIDTVRCARRRTCQLEFVTGCTLSLIHI